MLDLLIQYSLVIGFGSCFHVLLVDWLVKLISISLGKGNALSQELFFINIKENTGYKMSLKKKLKTGLSKA